MMTYEELDAFLREAAKSPDQLSWVSSVPEPDITSDRKVMTLSSKGSFRPNEMISIHIHPVGKGPGVPPGGEPLPHKHDYIEIPYLWAGPCKMNIEGHDVDLSPGDFVILDTESTHSLHTDDSTVLVNLAIEIKFFNDAFFQHFTKDDPLAGFFANTIYSQKTAKRYLIFEGKNDPRVRQLFSMIMQEYFAREVCCKDIIESLVIVLFSTMVRLQLQKNIRVTTVTRKTDDLVSQILQFMQENLSDISRETIAGHFGYSYSYITTILQAATGMTFSQLKKTLRLQKAELLLRTTDRPIITVAHDAGFSNVTSFYKFFKEGYGLPPLIYRKNHKRLLSQDR